MQKKECTTWTLWRTVQDSKYRFRIVFWVTHVIFVTIFRVQDPIHCQWNWLKCKCNLFFISIRVDVNLDNQENLWSQEQYTASHTFLFFWPFSIISRRLSSKCSALLRLFFPFPFSIVPSTMHLFLYSIPDSQVLYFLANLIFVLPVSVQGLVWYFLTYSVLSSFWSSLLPLSGLRCSFPPLLLKKVNEDFG